MAASVLSLIIFGICILLFVINRIPLALTALLGLCSMVLFNVCSYSEGFHYFGSSAVVLISAMMIVGKASFQTGLAQSIGRTFLNARKTMRGGSS